MNNVFASASLVCAKSAASALGQPQNWIMNTANAAEARSPVEQCTSSGAIHELINWREAR